MHFQSAIWSSTAIFLSEKFRKLPFKYYISFIFGFPLLLFCTPLYFFSLKQDVDNVTIVDIPVNNAALYHYLIFLFLIENIVPTFFVTLFSSMLIFKYKERMKIKYRAIGYSVVRRQFLVNDCHFTIIILMLNAIFLIFRMLDFGTELIHRIFVFSEYGNRFKYEGQWLAILIECKHLVLVLSFALNIFMYTAKDLNLKRILVSYYK